jgi:renalase
LTPDYNQTLEIIRLGSQMWDVAITGAGISGLTCAVALQEAGYRVVVIEKSKGVGGRVATRRLETAWADHGAPTLSRDLQDEAQYGTYVSSLLQRELIQPWPSDQIYQVVLDWGKWRLKKSEANGLAMNYAVPAGMTAIAKALTDKLNICRAQRVNAIQLDSEQSYWQISTETATASEQPMTLRAKALVLAIPAPQAFDLCVPLSRYGMPSSVLEALQGVTFDPCITVIAGYPTINLPWSELRCKADSIVQRIICDSHKRPTPKESWLVIHSTPVFAAQYREGDATEAGQQMLEHLGQVYLPWIATPSSLQVHRWRYAIARGGYPGGPLSANFELPFWICGDWCAGSTIQDAFEAGLDVAQRLQIQIET